MLKISRSRLWFNFSLRKPDNFVLGRKHPNPLNPDKTIKFTIYQESIVTLKIYNIIGEVLESFYSARFPPGMYSVKWNPENIFPGTYFYRLVVSPANRDIPNTENSFNPQMASFEIKKAISI
jgi:hypothetical protein